MQVQNINSYSQQNFGALRAKNLTDAMRKKFNHLIGNVTTVSDPPVPLVFREHGNLYSGAHFEGAHSCGAPEVKKIEVYHIATQDGSPEQADTFKKLTELGFEVEEADSFPTRDIGETTSKSIMTLI